ncbi:hypothetical protein [Thiorhodococcus fuscus]|uniref:Uncharacterized protein n=1 Tax=Thiorhodococcus fuscus TaxID=527200 RepID=A0ABW4Y2T9_9GAMM
MPSSTYPNRAQSMYTKVLGFSAALTLIAITGCQSQPSTPTVKNAASACMERCELAQSQCAARQELREQECQTHVLSPTVTSDNACQGTAYGRCLEPVDCLGADMGICETQYQECARTCEFAPKPEDQDSTEPATTDTTATADDGAAKK